MNAPTAKSVLTVGYTPLDILRYNGTTHHSAGGTAANVAAILAFLGWQAAVVADYGADLAGRRARADLDRSGVSLEHVRLRAGAQTPRVIHEVGDAKHRYLFVCPKCASKLPSSRPLRIDRAEHVIATTVTPDVFFFDRLNPGTIRLAEHYAKSGARVIFEPSRPARRDLTTRAVKAAHIIKHADSRQAGLDGIEPGSSSQLQIETLGAEGVRYRVGSGVWRTSPAFQSAVVDAGGAGDWTTAGLIHSLPAGRFTVAQAHQALAHAQALAALSCTTAGARGLAGRVSAEDALRVAAALQRKNTAITELTSDTSYRVTRATTGLCSCCLMPNRPTTPTHLNGTNRHRAPAHHITAHPQPAT